jgi:uncharacterized protein RhaS with RHS repeats
MTSLVHRYYDPASSQFLSVDPAVNLTQAPYAYTEGDPVNGVDPLGLHDCGWTDPLGCVANTADTVGHAIASHAGEIATVASLAALAVPGVDVIDLGVISGISINGALALTANAAAIGAGGIASDEDFSHGNYVAGSLDLLGSVAGLGALHLQGLANLDRLASGAAKTSAVSSWLLESAAGLARGARIGAFAAFGIGTLGTFLSGGQAWANTCS